ncbi:MAG: hypothetical protein N2381_11305, partial [Armatimonadetes bacterium]|nr:hypothetical protein [Armatimonadota bacterium]
PMPHVPFLRHYASLRALLRTILTTMLAVSYEIWKARLMPSRKAKAHSMVFKKTKKAMQIVTIVTGKREFVCRVRRNPPEKSKFEWLNSCLHIQSHSF